MFVCSNPDCCRNAYICLTCPECKEDMSQCLRVAIVRAENLANRAAIVRVGKLMEPNKKRQQLWLRRIMLVVEFVFSLNNKLTSLRL